MNKQIKIIIGTLSCLSAVGIISKIYSDYQSFDLKITEYANRKVCNAVEIITKHCYDNLGTLTNDIKAVVVSAMAENIDYSVKRQIEDRIREKVQDKLKDDNFADDVARDIIAYIKGELKS